MSIADRNRIEDLEKRIASLRQDLSVLVNAVNAINGTVEPNAQQSIKTLDARLAALEQARGKRG